MSISERLKAIIHSKGLNIKGFSDATEIPYRTVQNYLLDDRDPNVESLLKMATAMNINLHWLITGEGKMFVTVNDDLSLPEMGLIQAYRNCDNISQHAVKKVTEILGQKDK